MLKSWLLYLLVFALTAAAQAGCRSSAPRDQSGEPDNSRGAPAPDSTPSQQAARGPQAFSESFIDGQWVETVTIDAGQLPDAVRKSLDREFSGWKLLDGKRFVRDGQTVYGVEVAIGTHEEWEVMLSSAGAVLSKHRERPRR